MESGWDQALSQAVLRGIPYEKGEKKKKYFSKAEGEHVEVKPLISDSSVARPFRAEVLRAAVGPEGRKKNSRWRKKKVKNMVPMGKFCL